MNEVNITGCIARNNWSFNCLFYLDGNFLHSLIFLLRWLLLMLIQIHKYALIIEIVIKKFINITENEKLYNLVGIT